MRRANKQTRFTNLVLKKDETLIRKEILKTQISSRIRRFIRREAIQY